MPLMKISFLGGNLQIILAMMPKKSLKVIAEVESDDL